MRCCRTRSTYVPYTASHVVFNLQLLLFSGLAFFLMLGWLKRTLTITLDVDWLYRRLGLSLARTARSRGTELAWNAIMSVAAGDAQRARHPEVLPALSWPGRHSCPDLADRRDGVLDHHHAGRLSGPVVSVIMDELSEDRGKDREPALSGICGHTAAVSARGC